MQKCKKIIAKMQKEVYDFNRKMQQEIYYGFREKIESKKKRKNISAEYLAKELGISVSTVYRYEDSSILKIPVSTFEKCVIFWEQHRHK